jgi:hypothetical protein
MGCDPSGIAMAALAVCTAALPDTNKVLVKSHGGWKESARIWVGLAGPVSAKKTPMVREVTAPLNKIEADLRRAYVEVLAAYLRLPKDERGDKPPQPRIRVEDSTPEAIQPILKDNPNGVLLVRDELGGWFGSMDKYAGGGRGVSADRYFWALTFNGDPYTFDRVSRTSGHAENLSVSILGGIQTDALRKLVAEGVDDGLIQRLFIILLRPAVLGTNEPVNTDQFDALVKKLYEYQRQQRHAADFQFSEEAAAIRWQLEEQHLTLVQAYERVNKKLAAHIGKLDGLFARLCLLWHVIEHLDDKWPTSIRADTAQRVADFMHKFLLKHAIAFYIDLMGLADDHDRLANVAEYILAHKLEHIGRRDIQRGDRSMRNLTEPDTNKIFEQLEAFGWIMRRGVKRFKGPMIWAVNPEVHHKFELKAKEAAERRAHEHERIAASLKEEE